MAKLDKSSYPAGHNPEDFQCFGPPAINDGEFEKAKIADMGSFSQEEKDSNKYYHAAVVKSKINGKYFCYFEWGRVGAKNPQFQFLECDSEDHAQKEFIEQCREKNDKRGVWTTLPGTTIRSLTAKKGKDVYLVRQLSTRSTGLPDAKTIKFDSGSTKEKDTKIKPKNQNKKDIDDLTRKLLLDLTGGTLNYTRTSMADNSVPTIAAIEQARSILFEAQKIVSVVTNLDDQIANKDLRVFSAELYRRIPKIKPVGTPDAQWILSSNNIVSWNQDLDAFESSINSNDIDDKDEAEVDPYHGMPIKMNWIDPNSKIGKFLYYWWPKATANRHYSIKDMKIKNIWQVDRQGEDENFSLYQKDIFHKMKGLNPEERPLFQPNERPDYESNQLYQQSNTALLFHGTRSVNVKGILEKSLLMPKQLVNVAINGAMFGPGIYWADDWKKSAGYTSLPGSYWSKGSGSISNRQAFMFAADVVIGDPHIAPHTYGYTSPPKNKHSIFGMGSNHRLITGGPRFSSGVENNEWIIFNNNQFRLRYLAEFSA